MFSDDDDDFEINLPLEFPVYGTPVSLQGSGRSKDLWKLDIVSECRNHVPSHKFLREDSLCITIYDFPESEPQGDIDNIIKPILDALNSKVYLDDKQVKRVVAQRFLPAECDNMEIPPEIVARALQSGLTTNR